jgi:hypothetical protein
MFAAALLWLVTQNVVVATLLAGFVQLVLIVLALRLIPKAAGIGYRGLQSVVLLGVSAALALAVAHNPAPLRPFFFHFFIPALHMGSLFMSFWALGLGLMVIRSVQIGGRPVMRGVIAYALVCFLGGMSNLMFFAEMLAPLTAAIAIGLLAALFSWKTVWIPPAAGWPSAILGAVVNRAVLHASPLAAQSKITRDAIQTAFDVLIQGVSRDLHALEPILLAAIVWLTVCLAVSGIILGRQRSAKSREAPMLFLFCAWGLLSALASCAAVVLGGSSGLAVLKDYVWTTHYLHTVFFVPIFGLPVLITWWLATRVSANRLRHAARAAALAIFLVSAVELAKTPRPPTPINEFKPPVVAFLDDMSARYGLKYGLASYWEARLATMLSARGLRVYAVESNLNPFLWVANSHWFSEQVDDRKRKPPIDFVLIGNPIVNIPRETVVQRLGPPIDEARFANFDLLIYARHTKDADIDGPVAMADADQPLEKFSQQIASSTTTVSARSGDSFSLLVTIRNPGPPRWMSQGPFPVNVSYRWYESGRRLPVEGIRTALPAPLDPGAEATVNMRVEVPKDAHGDLTLKVSLVQESVAWFIDRGGPPLEIRVKLHN